MSEGAGLKTIYAKYKDSSGNTSSVVSTTIQLLEGYSTTTPATTTESVETEIIETDDLVQCDLEMTKSYKHPASPAVYYITTDCTKRAFSRSNVFFTYFTSWNDVKSTTKTKLDSIPNDTLGFMPWGPNYDPKYGALVKIVTDPKVYLLLNTEKYWITSETVFNTLNYAWNWIEDIDERLLNKYTIGSEITYTDHHPNYTIVKYEDNNKVYRLEPDQTDDTKQIKRWIPNETTFNSLNFRWDRIVTIPDTEVYETGDDLGVEETSTEYTFTSFLEYGDTGEEVKQLQIKLQELGYLSQAITPTTYFGPSTKAAVIKLQEENDLEPALGYVGPGTRDVLNGN
ncbi:peptidoglycan-binding protein [candidate division WWE3 bacterium]|nr:peptidoglycan-binding protein [candidate division WWE3 bacterium]